MGQRGFIIIFLILFLISFVSADTTISSCANLTTNGETYILDTNLADENVVPASSDGCINIYANNIVLDCQHHYIKNDTLKTTGVYSNSSGVTIKNCNITMNTTDPGYGIELSDADDSYVFNNTIYGCRYGIFLQSGTTGTLVENNTLISPSYAGIYNYASLNVIKGNNCSGSGNRGIYIRGNNNNITGNYLSDNLYGLYSYSSENCRYINNSFFSDSSNGLWLATNSINNYIFNNTIEGDGDTFYGISFSANANHNIAENNTIFSIDGYSVELNNVANITLEDNVIRDGDGGIYVVSGSNNISIFNNNIYGLNTMGIDLRHVYEINITSNSFYDTYGAIVSRNMTNSSFVNNNIYNFSNEAVDLREGSDNTIIKGNFFANHTDSGSSFILEVSDTSHIQIFNNTFLNLRDTAIYLMNHLNISVYNNSFINSTSIGVHSRAYGKNLTVYNNVFRNVTGAIDFKNGTGVVYNNTFYENLGVIRVTSSNNLFYDNDIYKNYGYCYLISYDAEGEPSTQNNTIRNENIHDNFGIGIYAYWGEFNLSILNNTIVNNSNGIHLDNNIDYSLVDGNNISSNRGSGLSIGRSANHTNITNNVFSNNLHTGISVHFDTASGDLRIENNSIEGSETGIYTDYAPGYYGGGVIYVINNSFTNNSKGVVTDDNFTNYLDNNFYDNGYDFTIERAGKYYFNLGEGFSLSSTGNPVLNITLPNGTIEALTFSSNTASYTPPIRGVYYLTQNYSDSNGNNFTKVRFVVADYFTNHSKIFYFRGGGNSIKNEEDWIVDYTYYPSYGQHLLNGHDTGIFSFTPPTILEKVYCSSGTFFYFDELYSQMKAPSQVHSVIGYENVSADAGATLSFSFSSQPGVSSSQAGPTTPQVVNYSLEYDSSNPFYVNNSHDWYFVNRVMASGNKNPHNWMVAGGLSNITLNFSSLSFNISYVGDKEVYFYDDEDNLIDSLESSGNVGLTIDQVYKVVFTGASPGDSVSGLDNYSYSSGNITGYVDLLMDKNLLYLLADTGDTGSTGGSGAWFVRTKKINNDDFEDGAIILLKAKERAEVKIDDTPHYIGVINIGDDFVIINVSSIPQQAKLFINQSKRFEVTGDKYYDVYVKLNSIENNKVNLTIKKIYEKMEKEVSVCDADVNEDGYVNILDLTFVRNRLGNDINLDDNFKADVNEDGRINALDLIEVRNFLGEKCYLNLSPDFFDKTVFEMLTAIFIWIGIFCIILVVDR